MSEEQEYEPTEEDKAKARELLDKTRERIFNPSAETTKWLFAAVVHLVTAEALGHEAEIVLRVNGKAIRLDLDPTEDRIEGDDEDMEVEGE